jgi:gamma-glutamyltranspeptidase/glutathione hydrolase
MVVCADSLATRTGLKILQEGGNAIDAAIATGFALAVTFPEAGNIGGGGFAVIRFHEGKTTSFDFRETAPGRAQRDMYLDAGGNVIEDLSTKGYLASGIPGTVAGFYEMNKKYGKLPWAILVQPAIDLAAKGFSVNRGLADELKEKLPEFKKYPSSEKVFMNNGIILKPGDNWQQPDLAKTLNLIAQKGAEGFYQGTTAQRIALEMKNHGGLISEQDLANYRAVERDPVRGTYRDFEIISMAPPSSGGTCLIQLLNILENYDMTSLGFHSEKSIHLIVEAERRVYADRSEFLGDPDFYPVPLPGLLSKSYGHQIAYQLDLEKATPSQKITHGKPGIEKEETTHYSIVDGEGNAVSVTYTLNDSFGSRVVIDQTGILMNDQMDDFSSKPGVPNMYGLLGNIANSIQPNKRMLSAMTPTIVTKKGKLFLVIGSPGGATIITTVLQVMVNLIDYGMSFDRSIAASRFHHQWLPDFVSIEKGGFDEKVLADLSKMGHQLKFRGKIGQVHGILWDDVSREYIGVADPRAHGVALGW